MISKCSSPMPSMTVWLVSSSRLKLNEGSSCASLDSPTPIFSRSPLDLGSIAILMTGSGKSMRSRMMGDFSSHSVSPVMTSLRPPMATMSPAYAALTSSRLFACIIMSRPMRSFLPLFALSA